MASAATARHLASVRALALSAQAGGSDGGGEGRATAPGSALARARAAATASEVSARRAELEGAGEGPAACQPGVASRLQASALARRQQALAERGARGRHLPATGRNSSAGVDGPAEGESGSESSDDDASIVSAAVPEQVARRKGCPAPSWKRRKVRGARAPGGGGEGDGHPWHDLAPAQRPCRKGAAKGLDAFAEDANAVEALRPARFAKTSRDSHRSRLQWWYDRCSARKLAPFPLSAELVELAGALLRRGCYRSGAAYISAMKRQHVLLGSPWTDQLKLACSDAVRSLERGMGPARQADPLPIDRLRSQGALDQISRGSRDAWPAAGVDVMVASAAWMLREIESSAAMVQHIVFFDPMGEEEGPCGCAEWLLPASKADVRALGKKRCLGCACPAPLCPVAALRRVVGASLDARAKARRDEQGRCWLGGRWILEEQWPLIVDGFGQPVSKDSTVKFYREVVELMGVDDLHITGHSARVAGAQRMAAVYPISVVQIFGRWGSSAVLRYVRDAALGSRGGGISRRVEEPDGLVLDDVHDRLLQEAGKMAKIMGGVSQQSVKSIVECHVGALSEELLPRLLAEITPAAEAAERTLKTLREDVALLQGDVAVLAGQGPPTYVQCVDGKLHVAASVASTHCGWNWAICGGVPATSSTWAATPVHQRCRKCSKFGNATVA
ncbi:unnamed protein product [Prorocentrum cordatum]|uniref:Uncharacterized protein n=1 Tax=Prorocentrum cordatum TaxID=2364126 RepID=A0ABN9PBX8_9DINO|nr:unnamed protein product [Polarella glacialis]